MTSFNILVSAYACEPDRGSEPEVGWQWVQQLARFNNVWVVTRANNKELIKMSKIEETYPNLHFVYCDLPKYLSWWKKGSRGVHLYYFLWQIYAAIKGCKLHKRNKFDLCHHLTFSPFYNPPIFSLLPIPFVWGPLGGGEKIPVKFLPLFRGKGVTRELVRIGIRCSAILNPFVLFAMFKAKLLIASTHETYSAIPKIFRKKTVIEMQIGMHPLNDLSCAASDTGQFKLITAGRQTYWKGHILVVKAFARFLQKNRCDAELTILGKGEESENIKNEVQKHKISENVRFVSFLPEREDVLAAFSMADVFVYASLLECAGYVVLEALSQGTPVICLNLPGPGEIVDDSCGIKVPCEDPEKAIENLSEAIEKLYFNRELLNEMSLGAIEKVKEEYSWGVKGVRLQDYLSKFFF